MVYTFKNEHSPNSAKNYISSQESSPCFSMD